MMPLTDKTQKNKSRLRRIETLPSAARHFLSIAFVVALSVTLTAFASAEPRAVEVSNRQLLWNPQDRGETKTGSLIWAGGVEISSQDGDFGGWSGLAVSPDGSSLLAVSDKGHWLTAIILYDERQRLSGLVEAKIAPILGLDGKPVASKQLGDAESLAVDISPSGSLMNTAYVSFERAHRIWRYDLKSAGAEARPEQILTQRHFGRLNSNGGIESLEL